jgi:hypothetical protein
LSVVARFAFDSRDDILGGNAESLDEFLGFSAARDLANREAADGQTRSGDRFRDRVPIPPAA